MSANLHPGFLNEWQINSLEYKRYKYKLSEEDTVLDIGAYQGDFAEEINRQHGCKVICVEPTDSIFRLQHKDWATIINKAAATKAGVQKFGGLFYYTSLFEGDAKYGYRDFPCFDVLELLNQPIALMKINIEGMEYDMMNHILDSGLQKNVQNFQIQFHLIDGDSEKEHKKIAKRLTETHDISWRCPFVWESWSIKTPTTC